MVEALWQKSPPLIFVQHGKKLGLMYPGSWIDILAKTVDADGTEWYRCYGNVYIMSRYLEVK